MKKPNETAKLLFKALMGWVALNQEFDRLHGNPRPEVLKTRGAVTGLVKTGIIAGDFIHNAGLDVQFRAYVNRVDREVSKIVEKNDKRTGGKK